MRRLLVAAAFAAAVGCGKKPEPPPADAGAPDAAAAPEVPERDRLLTQFKTKRGDPQRKAGDDLAALAEADPAVIDAVVELLRDRTTNGPGTTHPQRVGSTREAAAMLLVRCGPKGEAALKERGLRALAEGLVDKDAAVREHTAYTLGLLGPAAKPVAPSLQRLCSDPDAKVAAVAFDAVASVGVADVAAFVPLLTSENEATKRRAAEIVGVLPEVPADAVPTLARALADADPLVRAAAASGITAANGKGVTAKTGEAVGAAIRDSFPTKAETEVVRLDAPEFALWPALRSCGKHAAKPAADLLAHGNPLVRQYAARLLGDLGPDAKEAAEPLRKALADDFANVALEAGGALVRVGEKADEVDALVRAALASLNPGVAAEAIGAVARMGPAGATHHAAVLGKLDSPLPDARFAALGFVRTRPPAERVKQLPAIGKALGDTEPLVRGRAAGILEELGPAAVPAAGAARDALSKEDEPGVQEQLVNALAAMGPGAKAAVGAMLPLIADRAAGTAFREKLIATAVALDPASAEVAGAVKRAAGASDVGVRCAAARALGKLDPLPPDAAATLAKMSRTDQEVAARLAALRGLAAAGPRAKAVRADVQVVAEKGMPGVNVWAKVALAALDGDVTKAAPTVREHLASPNPNARAAAAEALQLVGPTAADVPALTRVLRDPSPAGKAGAAAALARLGPAAKDAIPKLVPLITDAESEVRVAAADAAAAVGLPVAAPAVPRLRDALREFPNDPPTVVAARRALARLGAEVEAPRAR
ncbi:MAG: HEAT repeat domain-containing protein [Gemmataceae bacterium]